MQRRKFLQSSSLVALGASILSPFSLSAANNNTAKSKQKGKFKNIIFMVSDGMSLGTLSMSNILHQHLYQSSCHWIQLYEQGIAHRALMETSSASSIVTDSAAASSAWGGGKKVRNGSLNYNASDKSFNIPIMRKMKSAGKAIGCVTTVPITHATPAGFCVATDSRNDQESIAEMYLELEPNVMLGGGAQYFDAAKRKDKKNLYSAFQDKGYYIAQNKQDLNQYNKNKNPKLIGTFADDALPYSIDLKSDKVLNDTTPTLYDMTAVALDVLAQHKDGFMLQIEAGKVDWAAHANDVGALLYDQLAFDQTIGLVKEFVDAHPDTLLIITTDHGNANPGVFYGKDATINFQKISKFKHSTDWVLNKINNKMTTDEIIALFYDAMSIQIKESEANTILGYYTNLSEAGLYNYKKLPYKYTAEMLAQYTNVKFADMDHSGDHVELAIVGKNLPQLPTFIQNQNLHHLILQLTL